MQFEVKLENTVVERVTCVKYLGVWLDQFMDFSKHVDTIVKKANFKLGFLYRNGRFMNFYVRRLLCQSLIFSNLEYCSPSWYFGLAAPLRESLNVLQRKCARFSLGHGPRSHIGNSELSSLHWLPFSQRVSYFSLVHAYKTKNGLSPTYISDSFTFITDVHSYNLRQCTVNFSLAHCLSPTGTYCRNVITDWNLLPKELKESKSLNVFKTSLKKYLQSS